MKWMYNKETTQQKLVLSLPFHCYQFPRQ